MFDYGSAVLSYYKEKSARAMFDEVDEDKSGYLDGNEVAGLCKSLGKKMGDTDIANAMLAMDRDGNNQVSFEEFEVWWNINGGKSAVKRGEVSGSIPLWELTVITSVLGHPMDRDGHSEISLVGPERTFQLKAETPAEAKRCVFNMWWEIINHSQAKPAFNTKMPMAN